MDDAEFAQSLQELSRLLSAPHTAQGREGRTAVGESLWRGSNSSVVGSPGRGAVDPDFEFVKAHPPEGSVADSREEGDESEENDVQHPLYDGSCSEADEEADAVCRELAEDGSQAGGAFDALADAGDPSERSYAASEPGSRRGGAGADLTGPRVNQEEDALSGYLSAPCDGPADENGRLRATRETGLRSPVLQVFQPMEEERVASPSPTSVQSQEKAQGQARPLKEKHPWWRIFGGKGKGTRTSSTPDADSDPRSSVLSANVPPGPPARPQSSPGSPPQNTMAWLGGLVIGEMHLGGPASAAGAGGPNLGGGIAADRGSMRGAPSPVQEELVPGAHYHQPLLQEGLMVDDAKGRGMVARWVASVDPAFLPSEDEEHEYGSPPAWDGSSLQGEAAEGRPRTALAGGAGKGAVAAADPDSVYANAVASELDLSAHAAPLSQRGLRLVPNLWIFGNLRSVDLSRNVIARLHSGILPRGLHYLDLSHNKLAVVEGLRELTRLRVLKLNSNRIVRIGHGLANCQSLRELYLSNNKIGEVEGLHRLLKLQILDLGHNKVATTKAVGQLATNFASMQALNILDNPVMSGVTGEQFRRFVLGVLPNLMYLNRQAVKSSAVPRDAAVERAVLGSKQRQRSSRPSAAGTASSPLRRSRSIGGNIAAMEKGGGGRRRSVARSVSASRLQQEAAVGGGAPHHHHHRHHRHGSGGMPAPSRHHHHHAAHPHHRHGLPPPARPSTADGARPRDDFAFPALGGGAAVTNKESPHVQPHGPSDELSGGPVVSDEALSSERPLSPMSWTMGEQSGVPHGAYTPDVRGLAGTLSAPTSPAGREQRFMD